MAAFVANSWKPVLFPWALVHAGLLLLNLLDDEQGRIQEPIDAVLETRGFRPAELARERSGDASAQCHCSVSSVRRAMTAGETHVFQHLSVSS